MSSRNRELVGMNQLYSFYKKYKVGSKLNMTNEERLKVQYRYLVDRKTFCRVLNDFNKELARMIIEEAVLFKMPSFLGKIRIRRYKKPRRFLEDGSLSPQSMIIDWNSTWNYWYKVYPGKSRKEIIAIKKKPLLYHLNEHSDGWVFKLAWSKIGSKAINKNVYSLYLTKTNKHMIAETIRNNHKIGYEQ